MFSMFKMFKALFVKCLKWHDFKKSCHFKHITKVSICQWHKHVTAGTQYADYSVIHSDYKTTHVPHILCTAQIWDRLAVRPNVIDTLLYHLASGVMSCSFYNTINLTLDENMAEKFLYSRPDNILISVVIPIITLFGIIGNSLFVLTVIRLHRMRNSLNAFLGNLAVSDILFLSTACVLFLFMYTSSPILYDMPVSSSIECVLLNVPFYFGHLASMGFVTLISIERFYAVCYPIRHRIIKRQKRTILLVTATWVGTFGTALLFIPSLSKNNHFCVHWPKTERFRDVPNSYTVCSHEHSRFAGVPEYISTITFILVLLINMILNGRITYTLSERSQNHSLQTSSYGHIRSNSRKVTLTLAVNTLVYFLFQTPYRIQTIDGIFAHLFQRPMMNFDTGVGSTLWIIGEVCLFLNSAINPIIFAVGSQFYRQGFRDALTRKLGTKSSYWWSRNHGNASNGRQWTMQSSCQISMIQQTTTKLWLCRENYSLHVLRAWHPILEMLPNMPKCWGRVIYTFNDMWLGIMYCKIKLTLKCYTNLGTTWVAYRMYTKGFHLTIQFLTDLNVSVMQLKVAHIVDLRVTTVVHYLEWGK